MMILRSDHTAPALTGMSISSWGLNRCSSKQKHWILLKYSPARMGDMLYVDTPADQREAKHDNRSEDDDRNQQLPGQRRREPGEDFS